MQNKIDFEYIYTRIYVYIHIYIFWIDFEYIYSQIYIILTDFELNNAIIDYLGVRWWFVFEWRVLIVLMYKYMII